jgi:hypothetical protein
MYKPTMSPESVMPNERLATEPGGSRVISEGVERRPSATASTVQRAARAIPTVHRRVAWAAARGPLLGSVVVVVRVPPADLARFMFVLPCMRSRKGLL